MSDEPVVSDVTPPVKRPRGNPNFKKGVRPYTVPADKMPMQMGGPVPVKGLKKKLPPWNDIVRDFMESKDKVGQKQRVIEVLQQAFNQAMDPRSPKQISAIDFLVTRYAGRAKMADEDSDTLKKAGITVVLSRPQLDPEIQHKALQPAPDFIDAQFTEDTKHDE